VSTLGEAADVNPVIKFLPHMCNMCGRNLITGLTSAASPRVDISSTCKVGQKLGVSLSLSFDMLLFGVTIPVTVPQRSKIPEGIMNCPVLRKNIDLGFFKTKGCQIGPFLDLRKGAVIGRWTKL
jgi:hypothetical protein